MLDPLQFYCQVLCNGMKTRFRMVMIAHPGPGIGFHKQFMWRIIIPPTTCTCILNPATFLHLDVSICPCQPSWRSFSSQTSPSGTTFPMGGVLSMCPPHPLFIFQLLHIHAHPLQPTQPPPGLCTHLCTLLHTSMHLAHHFFLGFSYTHSTSCALAHFHLYPIMGREILLSGQDSNLSSLGAYEGLALRGG